MAALLIDENVPPAISRFLRHRGFDIKEVHESYPGASDESLIELANREGRILVTFDRHFSDIHRHPLSRCYPHSDTSSFDFRCYPGV
jgi:predicted nuclease of predicted toxin-antitoxin system